MEAERERMEGRDDRQGEELPLQRDGYGSDGFRYSRYVAYDFELCETLNPDEESRSSLSLG